MMKLRKPRPGPAYARPLTELESRTTGLARDTWISVDEISGQVQFTRPVKPRARQFEVLSLAPAIESQARRGLEAYWKEIRIVR